MFANNLYISQYRYFDKYVFIHVVEGADLNKVFIVEILRI